MIVTSLPFLKIFKSFERLFERSFLFLKINCLPSGFHSCVGGCNGCFNVNESGNKGMKDIFDKLEQIYGQLELQRSGVSRADFWALAGIVAVEQASSEARYFIILKIKL